MKDLSEKKSLGEEIKATIVEAIFRHRWELLEGYHEAGRMMVEHGVTPEEMYPFVLHRKKDLHYARELFRLYPDLNTLPGGKELSWYKVCKTLPPYEKKEKK